MKKLFTLLCCLFLSLAAMAEAVTYDFSSSIPGGWTASATPNGFETTNLLRGTQFTTDATLTLAGVTDVTKVTITCSANVADKNTLSVSVGGNAWGTEILAKENNVEKVFSGNAASGNLVISITRAEKSVYISKVVVEGTVEGGGEETKDPEKTLDESYTYAEPTRVVVSHDACSNTAYSFINSNILVETSAGACTDTYFGCNAGNSITFTATQPIKAIEIAGYVKQYFSAEASSGEIHYVDATDEAVEQDPVVVILDVNSKSVTLNCEKQLRCYNVYVYFEENPDVDIDDDDDYGDDEEEYTYEWEPEAQTIDFSGDQISYADYSDFFGFPYTGIFLSTEETEAELTVFATAVEKTVLPVGVYEISDSYEDGTLEASLGGDIDYDYPCVVTTNYEEIDDVFYYDPFYLVSGTLTVADDPAGVKMVLNAKSYYGSTVTATFVGKAINLYDEEDEEGILSATIAAPASGKYIEKGGVVIRINGRNYNLNGIQRKN